MKSRKYQGNTIAAEPRITNTDTGEVRWYPYVNEVEIFPKELSMPYYGYDTSSRAMIVAINRIKGKT